MDKQRKVTGQPIVVEQHAEEHRYVVRLDLPGMKPATDIDVSVDEHVLTVRAGQPAGCCVTLPAGTDDRDVAATYRDGILEVSAGWQEGPTARQISVVALSDCGQ